MSCHKDINHAAQLMGEALCLYVEAVDLEDNGFARQAEKTMKRVLSMVEHLPPNKRRIFERVSGVMIVEGGDFFDTRTPLEQLMERISK